MGEKGVSGKSRLGAKEDGDLSRFKGQSKKGHRYSTVHASSLIKMVTVALAGVAQWIEHRL